jgi:flagellum-specific ATP synthase
MAYGGSASFLETCLGRVGGIDPVAPEGRVRSLVGTVIEVEGLASPVGSICAIEGERRPVDVEVVGFRGALSLVMPLSDASGVEPGARVWGLPQEASAPAADPCVGRILDGLGRPIDGGPPLPLHDRVPLQQRPSPALSRRRIDRPLDLGVRSINALLTVGRGARVGLFAGSGIGKSTLLGQISRFTEADVVVVALIGERGREVREFVERDLGRGLERSVVVVATSDQAPLLRRRAALLATAIAEQHRGAGRHVLLLMDSLTRFCTAQREIGLAAGEPPATRGYPPSVWSTLPQLLERAGTSADAGSITGIYTVLVEGDDLSEPVADAARALLDGHVVLSRRLAERGQYPPVDPLASVSRVMPDVASARALSLAVRAREVLSTHRNAEDLISIGAYVEGSDPAVDEARRLEGPLRAFLRQARDEPASLDASVDALERALAGATP